MSPEAAAAAAALAADDANAPNAKDTGGLYFVPQRPYLVLGTLRQQLLYPTWVQTPAEDETSAGSNSSVDGTNGDGVENAWRCGVLGCPPKPSDAALEERFARLNLGYLLGDPQTAAARATRETRTQTARVRTLPETSDSTPRETGRPCSRSANSSAWRSRVLLARPAVAMLGQ